MLSPTHQDRPISRATFGGITLLLVVAMAFQVRGLALAENGTGHGCGGRVVEQFPAIAQAHIARRSERADRREPAIPCAANSAQLRPISSGTSSLLPPVIGVVRVVLHAEIDMPPPLLG
ncbi:MAG: hypothetical protein U0637_02965 [Phycisphaerales bacterium]